MSIAAAGSSASARRRPACADRRVGRRAPGTGRRTLASRQLEGSRQARASRWARVAPAGAGRQGSPSGRQQAAAERHGADLGRADLRQPRRRPSLEPGGEDRRHPREVSRRPPAGSVRRPPPKPGRRRGTPTTLGPGLAPSLALQHQPSLARRRRREPRQPVGREPLPGRVLRAARARPAGRRSPAESSCPAGPSCLAERHCPEELPSPVGLAARRAHRRRPQAQIPRGRRPR